MSAATAKKKLAVSDLSAYYLIGSDTVRAVDNISFELAENESMAIVGESACGKSSLGAALMRSMQPPGKIIRGKVKIRDQEITLLSESDYNRKIRWKKVSMIFQGAMNALDPVYTVGSQMAEILREHRFEGDIEKKIIESLRSVGLDKSVTKRYPHELSGGMKQRVVIAMALLLEPEVLIADEPTTALDVLVQAQIINLLKDLSKNKGVTVILITHDLALVSEIASKIAIMYAGQIVEFSSADQIYKNPKHPYTQALISAIPKLRSTDKKLQFIKGSPPDLKNVPTGCRFYARCPHAMDMCKKDPPEIKTDDGFVRCWLYK